MKNATDYEKKVKKLLGKLPKAKELETFENNIALLVHAILEADATASQARKALKAIEEEYVDFNELRVSPVKEITEAIGRDYPFARDRAETILKVLGNLYEHNFAMNLDYLSEMSKRELRRHLTELGLDTYAEAVLSLQLFGAHAIPVDQSLVDCLKIDELIHEESDRQDVQGFLERIITQKNDLSAHQFFRKFVSGHGKALDEIHQGRMDAQKQQRQEANALAKAEAEAELAEERGQNAPAPKAKTEASEPAKAQQKRKSQKKTQEAPAPKAQTRTRKKTKSTASSKSADSKSDTADKASAKKTSGSSSKKSSGRSAGKTAKKTKKAKKARKTKKTKKAKKTAKAKKASSSAGKSSKKASGKATKAKTPKKSGARKSKAKKKSRTRKTTKK